MKTNSVMALSGALLAVGSLMPQTAAGLFCTCLSALAFAWPFLYTQPKPKAFLGCGFVFSAVAFYWLPETIHFFGGLPYAVAVLLFLIFCLVSALQFVIAGALTKTLFFTASLPLAWALPLAWLATEVLYPRLFPWAMGHAVSAWPEAASLAAFAGVPPISALVFLWGVAGAYLISLLMKRSGQGKLTVLCTLLLTSLLHVFGSIYVTKVEEEIAEAPSVKAAIIQGNLEAKDKGNVRLLEVNLEKYRTLTAEAVGEGAELVIWPESVFNYWTPEALNNVRQTQYDPLPGVEVALLYGGLSFRERSEEEVRAQMHENPVYRDPRLAAELRYHRYNSAFGIDREGNMLGTYHKRVLMPFGEYIPLSSSFPILKQWLPQTGDFSVGDLKVPIVFDALGGVDVRASVLICYEDLVPALAREASEQGANLLVNLTNDAWYGDTAAPHQHHLLALWRAIEAKRYLLRVTNTGLTAIVDPLGRTIETLPVFEAGYLIRDIPLLEGKTVYAGSGDLPMWIFSILLLLYCLVLRRRRRS